MSVLTERQFKEKWVVTWFDPNGDEKRTFSSLEAARAKAAEEDVAYWNPLIEYITVSTVTTSEFVS